MSSPLYVRNATWHLVPGHTVLVVIDDQNDFLHPEGWYGANGIDISHMQRVIEPTKTAERASAGAAAFRSSGRGTGRRGSRTAVRSWRCAPFLHDGGLRQDTWGYEILDELDVAPGGLVRREEPPVGVLPDEPRARPSRPRRRDGADHRRADEPVRRRDVEGRDVSGLQADRRRGVHRHDAAAPARAGDRDDPRRLGRGAHARGDAPRAAAFPTVMAAA